VAISDPDASEFLNAFAVGLRQTGGVSERETDLVLNNARVLQREAGDILFSAGDRLEDLYFVVSGLVRYYYLTPDGREFNKSFVSNGGVVTCLSSFLEARPTPFFTEALEPTVLVALPMEKMRELKSSEIVLERLINGFIAKLALQKEKREASFLLEDAAGRYEAFLKDFADLAPRLPQYHIASYLGITAVALSRIRARRSSRNVS
jgi:CRP-like cAMP-binding protein